MALPFLMGVVWCLRHWRQPAAGVLLLWVAVMLGPTILAADTPHFLRAAGVLPAVVILPALGLSQIADWLRRPWLAALGVGLLLVGSTAVTVRDYVNYSRDPNTSYLFEAAARSLAEDVNGADPNAAIFVDERYWSGWPAVPFLVTTPHASRFTPAAGLPAPLPLPSDLFVWPYAATDFVAAAFPPTALVSVAAGPQARGDLEPEAYPLFVRYQVQEARPLPVQATFGNASFGGVLYLQAAQALLYDDETLQVNVVWTAETAVSQPLTAFVHVIGPDGLVAQDDAPPGGGFWPSAWWRPGLQLQEQRTMTLPDGFDPAGHYVLIGLYDAGQNRLPVVDGNGRGAGDSWRVDIDK